MVTYTSTYNLKLPVVGQDDDAWGGYINDNTNALENLLTGSTTVTSLVITTADINGGTLDNVVIGGSTPAAITATGVSTDAITNSSGNLSISSTQSISMVFDSNNDQTNREFNLQHDSGASLIKVQESGDISFYEDTGATAKLFWDASAESLVVGASSTANCF